MATRAQQADRTRQRIVTQARTLFAERGFYGVSIAQVASALGLSKQGVLHHFSTKEKLYGYVLEKIASELADIRPQHADQEEALDHLVRYFVAMVADSSERVELYMLLMREILDNQLRAETAKKWYLKPFLEELTAMLRAIPSWAKASDEKILAAIIQLLGTVNYHAVSGPTFRGIFGAQHMDKVDAAFENQLRATVCAVMQTGPAD